MKQPSAQRLAANRANASKSTGPKSLLGRSRVGRNAFKHGLARAVTSDPEWANLVGPLASLLARPGSDAASVELAQEAAEAELELLRVRMARARLLDLDDTDPWCVKLHRYECRAYSRRKQAFRNLETWNLRDGR